jgi:hypothetical protein
MSDMPDPLLQSIVVIGFLRGFVQCAVGLAERLPAPLTGVSVERTHGGR